MDKNEKRRIEITLKNLLYFIEDKSEQNKAINALLQCEEQMKDPKLKEKIDKFILSTKKEYMDKVDFLVEDILSSKINDEKKKIIYSTIEQLKPSIDNGTRSFWDKLKDLFSWS